MKTDHVLIPLVLFFVMTLPRAGAAAEGYTDTPMQPDRKWHVHDPNRPVPKVITPGASFSHTAPAPSDAVLLFDGKDFSKWRGEKGDVQWKLENGYMETTRTGRGSHRAWRAQTRKGVEALGVLVVRLRSRYFFDANPSVFHLTAVAFEADGSGGRNFHCGFQ